MAQITDLILYHLSNKTLADVFNIDLNAHFLCYLFVDRLQVYFFQKVFTTDKLTAGVDDGGQRI